MGTPNKAAQMLRDTIILMVSHLAPFQPASVQRLAEFDIAYRGSPIIDGAGKRYFDDSLGGGSGILCRYLLILDNAADLSLQDAAKQLAAQMGHLVEVRFARGPENHVGPLRRPHCLYGAPP